MTRLAAGMLAALLAGLPLAGAAEPAATQPPVVQRGAVGGLHQRISFFYEVNPDCSSGGAPAVHILMPPQHGTLQAVAAPDYASFPATSQAYTCNLHKTPGTLLVYTGQPGFEGNDTLVVSVIYPHGFRSVLRYVVTVESADSVSVNRDGWKRV